MLKNKNICFCASTEVLSSWNSASEVTTLRRYRNMTVIIVIVIIIIIIIISPRRIR